MKQNDLEKFIERYPTYIEAIDIIENAKIIANKLCDDVYCILQKYHCKESIYEEIGQIIDNFKKIFGD